MADFYFGTEKHMQWFKAPTSGLERGMSGWSANGTFLNGGGWARRSTNGHTDTTLSWPFLTHRQAQTLTGLYAGQYGRGLIYWLDPFSMEMNALPPSWSMPSMARTDAPPLVTGKRPTLIDTPTNSLALPVESAVYTLSAGDTFDSLKIPVPPGYTLHFGAHGTATSSAGVLVNGLGTALLPYGAGVKTNTTSTQAWTTITLTGTGTLTLAAMTAVVLPTGQTPAAGNFVLGGGHSGCDFKGAPAVTGYSSPQAIDYQAVSVDFIEVGSWLRK